MRKTPIQRKVRLRKRKLILKGTVSDKMLDQACRAVVFARDGHKCRRCGSTSHLQWAHVVSRRYRSLRWSPQNGLAFCAGCHLWNHHQPLAFAAWFTETFGPQAHIKLQHALQSVAKIDRTLILLCLQRQLKELQHG